MSARRFAPARPVAVAAHPASGAPTGLRWRGRDEPVAAVESTWAVDAGWWDGAAGATRRRYYRLRTRGGLVCVVYRDLVGGGWYLDQVID